MILCDNHYSVVHDGRFCLYLKLISSLIVHSHTTRQVAGKGIMVMSHTERTWLSQNSIMDFRPDVVSRELD